MICVTGATGHLGNALVRYLNARGERVRCLVLPGDDIRPISGLDVELVTGDVRDKQSLLQAFHDAEIVFHLASVISILPGRTKLLEEVNVRGTRNVVEACLESRVSRLVYTSSIHALVERPPGETIDEGTPCDPSRILMPYGKSKARATLEVLAGVQKGLDAVIVVPTGIIGPYDYKPSDAGQFILDFYAGKIPACLDGGYDFLDVRDAALGHIAASLRGSTGSMYILSGHWASVRWLMEELARMSSRKAPRVQLNRAACKTLSSLLTWTSLLFGTKCVLPIDAVRTLLSNSQVSSEKARTQLGFNPRPLKETITDTVEWFKEAGMLR